MKCVAAVVFLSLQLAGSAFAAHVTSHTDTENVLEERQRNLKEKAPLNKEEKELLQRFLSEKTLRYTNEVDDEQSEHRNLAGSDPLSTAMRESALAKVQKPIEGRKNRNRKMQGGYGGYYGYGYGNGNGNGNGHGNGGGAGSLVYGASEPEYSYSAPVHVPKAEMPEKVSMVLEAFQDSRALAEPVLLSPDSSYLTAGTEYLYSNEPLFNTVYAVPPGANRPAYLVNTRDRIAVVSGSCTRTDPKTNYVGRSYCQFEYRFLDRQGNVEASIMAEGPVTKGDINTLSVTGGSGIFRRTVGTIVLEAGHLRSGNPPIFIPDDRLDLPSNYMVKMFVFMDSVDLELL
jgi:hypothetical protein